MKRSYDYYARAVGLSAPIIMSAGGAGLTLDSLLRSKSKLELICGIAVIGIAAINAVGYACSKLRNKRQQQDGERNKNNDYKDLYEGAK